MKIWFYLSREYIKLVMFVVVFFVSVYLIIDFLEKNSRYFVKYHPHSSVIFQYYALQIPKLVSDILPFAALIASLVTFLMLARYGEVAALRAAGQSVGKIGLPVLIWSALLSVISFVVNEFWVPRLIYKSRYVEAVKIEKSSVGAMFYESNWIRGDGSIVHFKRWDPVNQILENIEYFVLSSPHEIKSIVYAPQAYFDVKQGVWVLKYPVITEFYDHKTNISFEKSNDYPTRIQAQPPKILAEGTSADQVGYFELSKMIEQSKTSGGNLKDKDVELYQKLSLPWASVIFAWFGLSFAIRGERQKETYMGILICLLLAALYEASHIAMKGLAQMQLLHPFLAAWMTNLVFGLGMIWHTRRLNMGK